MGTSFTEFHGFGFWARDANLVVWLYLLVREIEKDQRAPAWLRDAGAYWDDQATVAITGCIGTDLDEILTDPDRIETVIALSEGVLAALREHTVLDRNFLNALTSRDPWPDYGEDVETRFFVRVGEAFLRLLRGQLTTGADSWDVENQP